MASPRDLTDAQWAILDPLIPEPVRRKDGRGRPWRPRRDVLNGILYILRSGAAWADLPERYPSLPDVSSPVSTMGPLWGHARRAGSPGGGPAQPRRIRSGGSLHRREFRSRQKGGSGVGKTKRGKGTKIMAVADRHGLPIAVCTESATPHEVTLVQQTLAEIFVQEPVQRLIGDAAYDSDKLDRDLAETGVEMIAPHRSNRKNITQDGRPLRRYRRRWRIERLFAWLQNFRRLVTRYEHSLDNFTGMLHLACSLILLRYL